jgi:3-hydroxyacyl-[acyl-carrier-protein] dehydratase
MSMKNPEELLPHRSPFLFIDRLEKADEKETVAYRKFTSKEFFFAGHFPQYPVVPGVILIETMAQAGGAGLSQLGTFAANSVFFLATVDKAKFRRQVRPEEEVRLVVENMRVSPHMIKQKGTAYVGEEVAAEAEWMALVQEGTR